MGEFRFQLLFDKSSCPSSYLFKAQRKLTSQLENELEIFIIFAISSGVANGTQITHCSFKICNVLSIL